MNNYEMPSIKVPYIYQEKSISPKYLIQAPKAFRKLPNCNDKPISDYKGRIEKNEKNR
jgi:hypothetical protein